ncbi:hypothetical protein KAI46_01490, partial [bacterium]|nr:hypothetical protein [bacterium]
SGEQKALKAWLEALLSLQPVGAQTRVAYLESLLLLNFQIGDYRGAVLSGRQLIREKPGFWADEKLYFHFIVALGQLDKCRDIVKIVPLKLPSYGAKEESLLSQRRLVLDMMAGRCLSKLGRFGDAKVFYRSLYAHYNESAVRLKLLALLYRLADKIQERKELDEWVSSQVMGHFSLDRREDVKLLRESPELVLLVAERLFRERLYLKVLPSLLWLDKLGLESELGERVTFLLAESYYRCEEVAEALVRFEILYAGGSKKIRYLAALRLVILYEAQGGETEGCQDKLKKLYQDLLAWESDPAARLELERKLIELK